MGLAAEARIAGHLGCPVAIGGGGAVGAGRAAASLVQRGVRGLLSFGLAGGIAPLLPAGAVIVPLRVMGEAGAEWSCDPALTNPLGAAEGAVLAVSGIVATAAAKAALWRSTGALAADIESGAVAAAAAAAGLGFAVLRVVCDPAARDLPPAALTALDAAGRIQPRALLRSLACHPAQVAALIALGRDAAAARRALLEQVRRIGPLASL